MSDKLFVHSVSSVSLFLNAFYTVIKFIDLQASYKNILNFYVFLFAVEKFSTQSLRFHSSFS